ncbi:MAG TPA: hypothetical protein VN890_00600 [Methylocella sp.]|nr:hypothetical protein [Methylocella sp.]
MDIKRLIVVAVLVPPLIYFQGGDENRLVHSLEARRYTDIQIEHPDQWHCSRRWTPYSYRARSPGGPPVHGGACVFFFIYETTEPIGKKWSARG